MISMVFSSNPNGLILNIEGVIEKIYFLNNKDYIFFKDSLKAIWRKKVFHKPYLILDND